jgi:hypothetical protein
LWTLTTVIPVTSRRGRFGQHLAEPVHAVQPHLLQRVQRRPRQPERGRVPANQLLPAPPPLADEPRPHQHVDVLGDGREAHRVLRRERGHRVLGAHRPAHDVAPGGVAQGVQDQIDLLLARSLNHKVER